MRVQKIKDGFLGEKQINIPKEVVIYQLRRQYFLNNLFITHIGYFPKARFHYRERSLGSHDNILIYCVDGKGHYQTETDSYVLQANQFMVLPRAKYHLYQADIHDPWTIYWVHFTGQKLKEFNKWLKIDDYARPTSIKFDKKIIELWENMYVSLQAGFTDNNLSYANLCLYHFLSFFLCPFAGMPALSEYHPVEDSISFMKNNIEKTLSIEDLASRFGYSSSHYTALFKKKTGSSPIDYFINLKISFACQLLSQTNIKINEVAGKIGYDDSFYFSRLFKKINGKSPKEYRQSFVRH